MDELEQVIGAGDASSISHLLHSVFGQNTGSLEQSDPTQAEIVRLFGLCLMRHIGTSVALPCLAAFCEYGVSLREYDRLHRHGNPAITWHKLPCLTTACKYNSQELVDLFLKYGADPNIKVGFSYGTTGFFPGINENRCVLFFACSLRFIRRSIVVALLSAGADPNMRDISSNIPLHAAISSERLDIAEVLLQYGSDANAVNVHRETPLLKALLWQHSQAAIVELLSQHGALLDDRQIGYPRSCSSYIVQAVESPYCQIELIRALVQHGVDVSCVDCYGANVLHLACSRQNAVLVKYFLAVKFDPDVLSHNSKLPLDYALWPKQGYRPEVQVAVVLRNAGARLVDNTVDTALAVCSPVVRKFIKGEVGKVLRLSILCKKAIRHTVHMFILPANCEAAYAALPLPQLLQDELFLIE